MIRPPEKSTHIIRTSCATSIIPSGAAPVGKSSYHPDEIRRTVGYVERNPLEIGLPAQAYPFVTPYDGWPLHPGHNPNSPYARRMRGT